MEISNTGFNGLKIINCFTAKDSRGKFVKVLNNNFLIEKKINFSIKEVYFSLSKKNVIRGMHFQLPPMQHKKIVFVSHGEITDVVIDLRKKSKTFGKIFFVNLSEENNKAILIPEGFAHGFKVLSHIAIVHYLQTSCYSKEHDSGILWSSIPFSWDVKQPIVSERDKNFIKLEEFINSNHNKF